MVDLGGYVIVLVEQKGKIKLYGEYRPLCAAFSIEFNFEAK